MWGVFPQEKLFFPTLTYIPLCAQNFPPPCKEAATYKDCRKGLSSLVANRTHRVVGAGGEKRDNEEASGGDYWGRGKKGFLSFSSSPYTERQCKHT